MPANYKPFDKAEWLRLEKKADELRRLTIQTAIWGGSGHLGGAMSAMDAMTILYHRFMKIDVNNPNLPDRDRFVLSKGHAAVGYAPVICGLSLPLLGLIFPPVRHAEQMINVRFDCHSLPHIRLGLAIFRIKLFLLSRQLTAGFF